MKLLQGSAFYESFGMPNRSEIYHITPSVTNHYPYLLNKLIELDEIETIDEPANDHYIIHLSYYKVASYFHNRRRFDPKDFASSKNIGFVAEGFLPNRLLNDLKNGKATLLISNDVDTIMIPQVLNMLAAFLAYGVPKESMIYTDSNPYVERILLKHGYKGFYYNWVNELFTVSKSYIEKITQDINSLVVREKKFLFFGGKPRQHRVDFLDNCINKLPNFEDNSFISIGLNNKVGKKSLDLYDEWHGQVVEKSTDGFHTPWDTTYNTVYTDYHKNSYWNISPGTYFNYEPYRISINEKQFKSIVALQPFIFLAEPRMLEFIKNQGYKTFSKWIDESYDHTLCDHTRMNKIIQQIEALNNLSCSDLSAMLKEMLPILVHNAELYMNTAKQNTVKTSLVSNLKRLINDSTV